MLLRADNSPGLFHLIWASCRVTRLIFLNLIFSLAHVKQSQGLLSGTYHDNVVQGVAYQLVS